MRKTIVIRLTHTNVWELNGEALQLCAVYKKSYFFVKLMQESVSSTATSITCNVLDQSKIVFTVADSVYGYYGNPFVSYRCKFLNFNGICGPKMASKAISDHLISKKFPQTLQLTHTHTHTHTITSHASQFESPFQSPRTATVFSKHR